MNSNNTYVTNDLGQVDLDFYIEKAQSLRSEAMSSHSCSLCKLIKERISAVINSWML
jgi:hypothetical protein